MKKKLLTVWRVVYPLLIYLSITMAVQLVVCNVLAIMIATTNGIDPQTIEVLLGLEITKYSMLMSALAGAITIPILYIFYRKDKKQRVYNEVVKTNLIGYILPVVFGMAVCFGFNWLIDISRIIEIFPGFNEVAENLYGGSLVFEVIAIVVVAPILEELLFRGIIYNRIKTVSNKAVAAIISALIFAIMHGNVVQGIYAFIIGICLVFVYEKYKALQFPMLFHAAANLLSVIITEVTVISKALENQVVYTITGVVSLVIALIMVMAINNNACINKGNREE